MVAGAVIAFTEKDLYPLFDLCGRAIPMEAVTDQAIGGLTMWIPAALTEVIGLLVALKTVMRLSAKGRWGNGLTLATRQALEAQDANDAKDGHDVEGVLQSPANVAPPVTTAPHKAPS
jgi:hypothetical protein